MIYVDNPIHPWRGKLWCHMFARDLDDLHTFAHKLGLKRAWFQEAPQAQWPHYDITAKVRAKAVALGAVECDVHKTLEIAHALGRKKRFRPYLRRDGTTKYGTVSGEVDTYAADRALRYTQRLRGELPTPEDSPRLRPVLCRRLVVCGQFGTEQIFSKHGLVRSRSYQRVLPATGADSPVS